MRRWPHPGWGARGQHDLALRLSFRGSGVRPFSRFSPVMHDPASRAAGLTDRAENSWCGRPGVEAALLSELNFKLGAAGGGTPGNLPILFYESAEATGFRYLKQNCVRVRDSGAKPGAHDPQGRARRSAAGSVIEQYCGFRAAYGRLSFVVELIGNGRSLPASRR